MKCIKTHTKTPISGHKKKNDKTHFTYETPVTIKILQIISFTTGTIYAVMLKAEMLCGENSMPLVRNLLKGFFDRNVFFKVSHVLQHYMLLSVNDAVVGIL